MKQLEARLRALEDWREMMEIERGGTVEVTGFYIEHEYEDPAMPETWIEKGKKR